MTVVAQRMWGEVPDNAHVLLHNKPVLRAIFGFEGKVATWKALDPDLKTYAVTASAATISCSWCLDFGLLHGPQRPVRPRQDPRGAPVARLGGLLRPRA
ncbi:hypothetical protein [Nocardioides sp.]|uniref:hypothetical protein n=1 Tax=Nocardioides sp. TaxID=35761 RepID=UPI002613A60F|nr:hypothetical protein [Nocardioides sp.]